MLLLGASEVRSAIESNINEFLTYLKDALIEKSSGEGWYPPRISSNLPKGWIGFMPAFSRKMGFIAMKIVGVFPGNRDRGMPTVPATVLLFDPETGDLLSLMDGTVVTEYRTAGASALSVQKMARGNAHSLMIVGAGTQGRSHARLIQEVRELEVIYIRDINRKRAETLAEWVKNRGIDSKVVDSNIPADIIVTATTSKHPVLLGADIPKGGHVCAIGAYTPDARELDDSAISSFDRIVVDTKEALDAGDLKIPLESGVISMDRIVGELGEVLSGKITGRSSDNEKTLYKAVGTSSLDVAAASFVYKAASKLGLGREVSHFTNP